MNDKDFPDEEVEELNHFRDVQGSFIDYYPYLISEYTRRKNAYKLLPEDLKSFLNPDLFGEKQKLLKAAIKTNSNFLRSIVYSPSIYTQRFGFLVNKDYRQITSEERNISKVITTLHQLVRDWAVEGKPERDMCYSPLLDTLQELMPISKIKILTPGAGLGRLSFEIASLGYESQGNEFSYQMLLASNFMFNNIKTEKEFKIYPWIDQTNNVVNHNDMFCPINIPDICPSAILSTDSNFSMAAGEFVEVYKDQISQWDAIVSCFFLDTAPNIIQYLKVIYDILVPGGYLINIGPLLYHFNGHFIEIIEGVDERYLLSFELSYEEIKSVMINIGYIIVKDERRTLTYTKNPSSMMWTTYDGVFFVAQKPIEK